MTTAAIAPAGGASSGSCASAKGAITSSPCRELPDRDLERREAPHRAARVQHGGRVAERSADHGERTEEVATGLRPDEERDTEEADADPHEPRPGHALAGVHPHASSTVKIGAAAWITAVSPESRCVSPSRAARTEARC